MSHTLQTAITFPVLTCTLVAILTTGPVLYYDADISSRLHKQAVLSSLSNTGILHQESIREDFKTIQITSSSPEKMHFLARAVCDSAILIFEGVE
jgi:hypothetical protein